MWGNMFTDVSREIPASIVKVDRVDNHEAHWNTDSHEHKIAPPTVLHIAEFYCTPGATLAIQITLYIQTPHSSVYVTR